MGTNLLEGWGGWHLKNEGAASHPGVQRHTLQYDGRPDWRFEVLDGRWNLGSQS